MKKQPNPMLHQQPTELKISKTDFKTQLENLINKGLELYKYNVTNQREFEQNQTEFNTWNSYNKEFLKQVFNNENNEYRKSYSDAGAMIGFYSLGVRNPNPSQKIIDFKEKIDSKVKNLQHLQNISDLLKSKIETQENSLPRTTAIENSDRIFIVHGHDNTTKLEVARTIEKLGLTPIILHEQANGGKTIIEKFELNSEVSYAVVIMTCDDLGKAKASTEEKYRARQNVILELGYFIGKLGRARVFPLYEDGVELPSDLYGLLYNHLDERGTWKFLLVKELQECGFDVDANSLLR